MPKVPADKSHERSEEEVLDQAIRQLLCATKEEAKKKGKPLDRAQPGNEGCSERFIAMVE